MHTVSQRRRERIERSFVISTVGTRRLESWALCTGRPAFVTKLRQSEAFLGRADARRRRDCRYCCVIMNSTLRPGVNRSRVAPDRVESASSTLIFWVRLTIWCRGCLYEPPAVCCVESCCVHGRRSHSTQNCLYAVYVYYSAMPPFRYFKYMALT